MDRPRHLAATCLAGLVLAVVLAGCQSITRTSLEGSPRTPTTWAPPPPPDGETTLINTGDYGFHSPSGNITCHMLDKPGDTTIDARCDINIHSYKAPSSPGVGCPSYNSMSIGVDGPGEFPCTPASGAGTSHVLAYWDSVQVGRFTCKSKDTGVDCQNTQTQHGFELGAAAFRRY